MPVHEIVYLVCCYLLGSISFGYLVFFFSEKSDIRAVGSGNIGATNVLRSKGKAAGLLTLFLDVAKGAAPVLYGWRYFESREIIILGGLVLIIGHIFPVFLSFRGGKGVASFAGFWAAFDWRVFLIFLGVFLVLALFTRLVSLSSLFASAAVFLSVLILHVETLAMIALVMVVLIVLRHRANIKRLLAGEEKRISLGGGRNG